MNNTTINQALSKKLQSVANNPSQLAEIIADLSAARCQSFSSAILGQLSDKADKDEYSDAIHEWLGYLRDCRAPIDAPTRKCLRELRLYPYDSAVRNDARLLLGEAIK